MFPDQSLGRPNLAVVQAVILRQFDLRLKPEFRFPVRVMNVHVEPGLLAREEKEPESVLAKDCRAQGLFFRHLTVIHQTGRSYYRNSQKFPICANCLIHDWSFLVVCPQLR